MSGNGSCERARQPRRSSRQDEATPQAVPDSVPLVRKPRVLRALARTPVSPEERKPPIGSEQRIAPDIPSSQFVRIRTWVKYGMSAAQVAAVYGVAVDAGEVLRLRRQEKLGPAVIARRLGIGRASVYRLLGKHHGTVSADGGKNADQA